MKHLFVGLVLVACVYTIVMLPKDLRRTNEDKATAVRVAAEKTAAQKQFEKDIISAEKLTRPSCSETLVVVVWPPANLPEAKPRVVIAGYNVEDFNSMSVNFHKNHDGGFELRANGGEVSNRLPADGKFCRTEAEYQLKHPR